MPWKQYGLAIFAGLLFTFGFPSFLTEKGVPLFLIFSLSILFSTLNFEQIKKDLLSLFLYCTTVNLCSFYWVPQTLETFGQIPAFVSFFLFFLFGFIVLPFVWSSYFVFLSIKKSKFIGTKTLFQTQICIAFLLTLVEYLTPIQFPVRFGLTWMNFPTTLGLTPIFGLPLFSFLTYLFALSIYAIVFKKRKNLSSLGLATSILLISIFIRPYTFQKKSLTDKEFGNFFVRIVQVNIGNYMKVQSELGRFESMQEVYSRYFSESMKKSELDLDLIIWPETAYPDDLDTDFLQNHPSAIPQMFKNIISEMQVEFLFGGYDKGQLNNSVNGFKTLYNSAFHFSEEGYYQQVYHKHQLIPFGETLPFGPITPYLKDHVPGVSFFSQDLKHTLFTTKNNFYFVVPICYETLSPQHISDSLKFGNAQGKQPHFIINLANDSWYGITAQPYQHLFLAKWRAVEFQTPLIRSTNSGITSIFDVDGEESKRLELGEVNHLDLPLKLTPRSPTVYQKLGIWSFIGFFFTILFVFFLYEKINRKDNQERL